MYKSLFILSVFCSSISAFASAGAANADSQCASNSQRALNHISRLDTSLLLEEDKRNLSTAEDLLRRGIEQERHQARNGYTKERFLATVSVNRYDHSKSDASRMAGEKVMTNCYVKYSKCQILTTTYQGTSNSNYIGSAVAEGY
jgi:hypothetical protein